MTICILLFTISAQATTQQFSTPIVLKSATTIEPGTARFRITLDETELNAPFEFSVETFAVGGTFSLELNGDLTAQWDDAQVTVGDSFPIDVFFQNNPGSVGTATANYSYLLRSSYKLNLADLFHNNLLHWRLFNQVFNDYALSGVREGRFPETGTVPQVDMATSTTIASTQELFLLADSVTAQLPFENAVSFSYEIEPVPCVRLRAYGRVRTSFAYVAGVDTLCLRYSASKQDTLCWRANTGFDCLLNYSSNWTNHIQVPCAEVQELIVPLCPIKAAGQGRVDVGTKVELDSMIVEYTCSNVPAQPPPIRAVAKTDSLAWFSQSFLLETDRDDAIFPVDVFINPVALTVMDSLTGTTFAEGDTLRPNTAYEIQWDELDTALTACCGSPKAAISYRDAVDPDPNTACYGTISTDVPSSNYSLRSYDWRFPGTSCLQDGDTVRLFIEFYCPGSERVTLFRAWTDEFHFDRP